MEWLTFLRLTVAFGVFYIALPLWARGAGRTASASQWASTFVRFCCFVEIAVVLLGVAGLALPGAVLTLCALSLGADILQREPALLIGPEARRAWLVDRLSSWKQAKRRIASPFSANFDASVISFGLLLAVLLFSKALSPIGNLRFADLDGYARSLSLAVLGNGHSWTPDLSVPLLLPLHYLGAASAPRVVAFSEPLFAAVLAAAVGFATYQWRADRFAALAATGCAAISALTLSHGGNPELARAEMGVVFLIFACGLWRTSRLDALLASTLGVVTGFTTPNCVESIQLLLPFGSCVLFGIGVADFQLPIAVRRIVACGLASALVIAGASRAGHAEADGPVQYEDAARLAHHLVGSQPRNGWALVSTTQELPFVYGSGWHIEMTDFVGNADLNRVADPSYRFPFPVKDIYFLVETRPLEGRHNGALPAQVRVSPTPSSAYSTALERASLEFQAAQLLSVYRGSHSDLETVYQNATLTLYRVDGSLRD